MNDINEPIDLYAVFKKGKIIPIAFKWKKDKFIIDDINIAYTRKNGAYKIYHYSILSHGNYFSISVNGKDNSARIHQAEYQ